MLPVDSDVPSVLASAQEFANASGKAQAIVQSSNGTLLFRPASHAANKNETQIEVVKPWNQTEKKFQSSGC